MPNSSTWSNGSAACPPDARVCRIDWRPSRLLVAALAALGPLGAWAVLASEMPDAAAWPLALAAVVCGGRLAWREARRPPRRIVFAPTGVLIDDIAAEAVALRWRGPLATLVVRVSGRTQRLQWWPDTLDAASRRELRLAAPDASRPETTPAMAP
ncbi:hypothetical protein ACFOED_02140 [Vulcaniibacterium thermophilum]|jgi:toxin CptA|nr:hypothetical protein [Vulcaniibacterium thermophilum]